MAGGKVGLHEERTRVVCHLPLNDSAEEKAVNQVIAYLQDQRKEPFGVKGFTQSSLRPASFRGYWWSSERKKWVREPIVLLLIDYKLDIGDEQVAKKLSELKAAIRKAYKRCTGKAQEEVWVVAEQVMRYD